jgi:putative endonuclease
MTSARRAKGDLAEQAALEYLLKQKLHLIERNYLCRRGEIDLLMAERNFLGQTKAIVAIEVRYRQSAAYGAAAETVGSSKQQRLISAAQHYMAEHPHTAETPWRFDVVALQGDLAGDPLIDWIPNAFEVC